MRRARYLVWFVLIIVLVLLLAFGFFIFKEFFSTPAQPSTPPVDIGRFSPDTKIIISNDDFLFSSSQDWKLAPEISIPNEKYVYFSSKKNQIQHQLTIYVRNIPLNTPVKFILPVKVVDNKMETELISQECGTFAKGGDVVLAEFKGISFYCETHTSKSIIAAGFEGSSYAIPLRNAKGNTQNVAFFYHDQTSGFNYSPLSEVLSTFVLK